MVEVMVTMTKGIFREVTEVYLRSPDHRGSNILLTMPAVPNGAADLRAPHKQ